MTEIGYIVIVAGVLIMLVWLEYRINKTIKITDDIKKTIEMLIVKLGKIK